jgi:Cu(I)/Ag(I) efflux system protein CusF
MKRIAVLILGLAAGSVALAQGTHDMDMKEMQAKQTHKTSGTVTRVDRDKSRVTISHGAVETLKWPAMTMTFSVPDKAMLEKLQPGHKVDFQFVQHGKDYVITGVK